MVLANQTGKTVDRLRSIALVMLVIGAAVLTACGGGGGSRADAAGPGPGAAPTVSAEPLQVLFVGDNGKTGRELYRTDGTAAGTVLVKDINAKTQGSNPANLVVADGATYFTASDGHALWKTDGTAAGTVQIKNVNPTSRISGNIDEFDHQYCIDQADQQ